MDGCRRRHDRDIIDGLVRIGIRCDTANFIGVVEDCKVGAEHASVGMRVEFIASMVAECSTVFSAYLRYNTSIIRF